MGRFDRFSRCRHHQSVNSTADREEQTSRVEPSVPHRGVLGERPAAPSTTLIRPALPFTRRSPAHAHAAPLGRPLGKRALVRRLPVLEPIRVRHHEVPHRRERGLPRRHVEGRGGVLTVVNTLEDEVAVLVEMSLEILRGVVEIDGDAEVVLAAPEDHGGHLVGGAAPGLDGGASGAAREREEAGEAVAAAGGEQGGEEAASAHAGAGDAVLLDRVLLGDAGEHVVEELVLLLDADVGVEDGEGPAEDEIVLGLGDHGGEAVLVDGGLDVALLEEAVGVTAQPVPQEHDGQALAVVEILGQDEQELAQVAHAVDGVEPGLEVGTHALVGGQRGRQLGPGRRSVAAVDEADRRQVGVVGEVVGRTLCDLVVTRGGVDGGRRGGAARAAARLGIGAAGGRAAVARAPDVLDGARPGHERQRSSDM